MTPQIETLVNEGMDEDTARVVCACARKLHRLSITSCNRELTQQEAIDEKAAERLIRQLPEGFKVTTDGDPRGYVVRVFVPSERSNNFGGGIGIK